MVRIRDDRVWPFVQEGRAKYGSYELEGIGRRAWRDEGALEESGSWQRAMRHPPWLHNRWRMGEG